MQKYLQSIKKCILFNGIKEEQLISVLGCLGGQIKEYNKNDIIISEGEQAIYLGVILEGSVHINRIDFFGNRSIIAHFKESEMFGETFAAVEGQKMSVNVVADDDSKVLLIKMKKILTPCESPCFFHSKIILNLLQAALKKNLIFNKKIEIISKKTTKEKLMCYLLLQAKENNSNSFTIPFDRQELADYLEVDRSGLSVEINKLKAEGVIDTNKSYFKIL